MKHTLHTLYTLLLMLTGLLFGSCAEDITAEATDSGKAHDFADMTRFSEKAAESSQKTGSMQKTMLQHDDLLFNWTPDDHIWLLDGTSPYQSRRSTIGTEAVHRADFYFDEGFDSPTYPVRYTGQTNTENANGTTADAVSISAVQAQAEPNNSWHIATDGDCGTATATKQDDGSYEFTLHHKAAYLIFTPKLATDPVRKRYLTEIVVRDKEDKTICGKYRLDDDGLKDATDGGTEVKLRLGEGNDRFELTAEKSPDNNAAYMVIEPGVRQLEVVYYIKSAGYSVQTVSGTGPYTYGEEAVSTPTTTTDDFGNECVTVTKQIASRTYNINGVTRISHTITPDDEPQFQFEFIYTYYQWDARAWYWHSRDLAEGASILDREYYDQQQYRGYWEGGSTYDYPKTQEEEASGAANMDWGYDYATDKSSWPMKWRNYRYGKEQGMFSCSYCQTGNPLPASGDRRDQDVGQQLNNNGYMPNVNRMTYYLAYGDAHVDYTTLWRLDTFGNRSDLLCRGGIWFLKEKYMSVTPSDDVAVDINGNTTVDLRAQWVDFDESRYKMNTVRQVVDADHPIDTEKYFFVPFLGCYENGNSSDLKVTNTDGLNRQKIAGNGRAKLRFVGARGYYWTASPRWLDGEDFSARWSYFLYIDRTYPRPQIRVSNRYQGYVANKRSETYTWGTKHYAEDDPTRYEVMKWFQ